MNQAAAEYFESNPTAAELAAVLGARWAICRDTPKNRARYGRCLTAKAYRRACAEALELRQFPNSTWSERAVFKRPDWAQP